MHQKGMSRWQKHLDFMLLDVLTLGITFYVVCLIRMHIKNWSYSDIYRSTLIALVFLAISVSIALPLHKNIIKRGPFHELTESIKYVSILAVGIMMFHFLTQRGTQFSRGIFLMFWVGASFTVWLIRTLYKTLLKKVFLDKLSLPELILFLTPERAADVYQVLEKKGQHRYGIGGVFIVGEMTPEQKEGIPEERIVGGLEKFEEYTLTHTIDEAYINLGDPELENLIAKSMITRGIPTHIALPTEYHALPNQEIERIGGNFVLTSSVQSTSAGKLLIKRIVDIVGSLVGLVLTGIAFVIFAPIIKTQSQGPVFYEQERVGLNGRRFKIYKFRTMIPNADAKKAELMDQNEMKGQMFKIENDPRIIPIGRFMRKHSIDEMPQFWNVLKGDMSLVGTRPPTVDEWEEYRAHHRARMSVKPGITGLWQVSGRSDILDFEEVVELDMTYIRNWSIKMDLKLLLRTVQIVFAGKGAK